MPLFPLIPVVALTGALVGGVIYLLRGGGSGSGDNGNEEEASILQKNFKHLRKGLENEKNDGNRKTIAIIGQPGSGKSSLLKAITDGECEPLPTIGQQTDATDWHREEMWDFFTEYKNDIFVDIPGYGTIHHPTDSYMDFFPFDNFDKILLILQGAVCESDEKIFKKIDQLHGWETSKKVFVIRNFSESLGSEDKESIRCDYDKPERFDLKAKSMKVIFSSARTEEGIEELKKILFTG
jgi:GTPase Era involved in 16S rRNA processing